MLGLAMGVPARRFRFGAIRIWDWLIVVSAAVTIIVGVFGWHRAIGAPDVKRFGWDDDVYRAVGLLVWGGSSANLNGELRWARWFGIFFSFASVVRFLGPRVGVSWTRLRARAAYDHEIIVGLGAKGRALLERDRRRSVVAIDIDAGKVNDPSLPRGRTLAILGDGRTEYGLASVHASRARRIIIATRDDSVNIEIAQRVARLDGQIRRELPVFVHVADPVLRNEAFPGKWVLGSVDKSSTAPGAQIVPRPFALPSAAARLLLERFPVAVRARETGSSRLNLVFLGFDAYAEALCLHALRLGALDSTLPTVTIFVRDPEALEAKLRRRYAGAFDQAPLHLGRVLQMRRFDADRELTIEDLSAAEPDGTSVTAIFVHAPSDAECFAAALRARHAARRRRFWKAPLFFRVDDASAFAGAITRFKATLHNTRGRSTPFAEEVLEPYGDLHSTVAMLVDGEWSEKAARHAHEYYLGRKREKHTPDDGTDVAYCSWANLPEELRESNRRAVDHYVIKLAVAGYVTRGNVPRLGARQYLEAKANDRVALLEHASWCREKAFAGWRYGLRRDDLRKRHPCLIDFDRLSESDKQLDRDQLIAIEEFLGPGEAFGLGGVERPVARSGEHGRVTVFRERIIALAGHNVVDLEKTPLRIRAGVERLLEKMGADSLFSPSGDEYWTFVTPLAPGCDFILACAALAHLEAKYAKSVKNASGSVPPARRYRMRIVQALPVEALVEAWDDQGGFRHGTPDGVRSGASLRRVHDGKSDHALVAKMLREFATEQPAVEEYLDLGAPDRGEPPSDEPRRTAFERTDQYLLDQAHDLIVALDPDAPVGNGGGTRALVDHWKARSAANKDSAVPRSRHCAVQVHGATRIRPQAEGANAGDIVLLEIDDGPAGLHRIDVVQTREMPVG